MRWIGKGVSQVLRLSGVALSHVGLVRSGNEGPAGFDEQPGLDPLK